jgi:hypothetical protein
MFAHKPDGTGRTVFAVDFRVLALETFLAQVNLVFHAAVWRFPVRMVGTPAHGPLLLFYNGNF